MATDYRFGEYEEEVRKTRGSFEEMEKELAVVALGISGEAGEVAEHVKKVLGHGSSIHSKILEEELGDVLFYLCWMANLVGSSLDQVALHNIDKLRRRYPHGFSHEASKNREE